MARKVNKYRTEFKIKAVELSKLKGAHVLVTNELEIRAKNISRWSQDYETGEPDGSAKICNQKSSIALQRHAFLETFPNTLARKRFQVEKLKEISVNKYDLMLTHYKKRQKPISEINSKFHKYHEIDFQESFTFLRTENGYKLITASP